jgi:DNA-binding response OmpR family regulator
MAQLLLVEDDPSISEPLARALTRDGYEVRATASGEEAVALASGGGFDLVLLDLTLPDVDGLEVCRRIRAVDAVLPIVMLTARADEIDLVVGFDAGADDYVAKPFGLAELLARVRARLRLAEPAAPPAVQGVRVDAEAHRAFLHDRELDLTPKEFDLLALLVADAGHVVPRQRIMRDVWDEHWYGSTRTLDVHLSALRRKLGDDPAAPRLITTVRGVGFRFETG